MRGAEAEREVDNIMSSVDSNNSGFIDYSGILNANAINIILIEFVSASINRQQILSKERLEKAFRLFDKVSQNEIKKI